MPQHPALFEILARDRAAELRRAAAISSRRRGHPMPSTGVTGARRATGWFLVDIGLRLAVPRGITRSA